MFLPSIKSLPVGKGRDAGPRTGTTTVPCPPSTSDDCISKTFPAIPTIGSVSEAAWFFHTAMVCPSSLHPPSPKGRPPKRAVRGRAPRLKERTTSSDSLPALRREEEELPFLRMKWNGLCFQDEGCSHVAPEGFEVANSVLMEQYSLRTLYQIRCHALGIRRPPAHLLRQLPPERGLAAAGQLHFITGCNTYLSPKACQALAVLLPYCTHLEQLDLRGTSLRSTPDGRTGLNALLDAFLIGAVRREFGASLHTLDLSLNPLNDSTGWRLLRLIELLPQLREIRLEGTDISEEIKAQLRQKVHKVSQPPTPLSLVGGAIPGDPLLALEPFLVEGEDDATALLYGRRRSESSRNMVAADATGTSCATIVTFDPKDSTSGRSSSRSTHGTPRHKSTLSTTTATRSPRSVSFAQLPAENDEENSDSDNGRESQRRIPPNVAAALVELRKRLYRNRKCMQRVYECFLLPESIEQEVSMGSTAFSAYEQSQSSCGLGERVLKPSQIHLELLGGAPVSSNAVKRANSGLCSWRAFFRALRMLGIHSVSGTLKQAIHFSSCCGVLKANDVEFGRLLNFLRTHVVLDAAKPEIDVSKTQGRETTTLNCGLGFSLVPLPESPADAKGRSRFSRVPTSSEVGRASLPSKEAAVGVTFQPNAVDEGVRTGEEQKLGDGWLRSRCEEIAALLPVSGANFTPGADCLPRPHTLKSLAPCLSPHAFASPSRASTQHQQSLPIHDLPRPMPAARDGDRVSSEGPTSCSSYPGALEQHNMIGRWRDLGLRRFSLPDLRSRMSGECTLDTALPVSNREVQYVLDRLYDMRHHLREKLRRRSVNDDKSSSKANPKQVGSVASPVMDSATGHESLTGTASPGDRAMQGDLPATVAYESSEKAEECAFMLCVAEPPDSSAIMDIAACLKAEETTDTAQRAPSSIFPGCLEASSKKHQQHSQCYWPSVRSTETEATLASALPTGRSSPPCDRDDGALSATPTSKRLAPLLPHLVKSASTDGTVPMRLSGAAGEQHVVSATLSAGGITGCVPPPMDSRSDDAVCVWCSIVGAIQPEPTNVADDTHRESLSFGHQSRSSTVATAAADAWVSYRALFRECVLLVGDERREAVRTALEKCGVREAPATSPVLLTSSGTLSGAMSRSSRESDVTSHAPTLVNYEASFLRRLRPNPAKSTLAPAEQRAQFSKLTIGELRAMLLPF